HEMGHVVNYAYKLYDGRAWTAQFGDINLPYEEEYRPRPFDRRFVMHLPGWYAQKHPDEDWAETFAVWMTPGLPWRARYAGWPALKKLEYCDGVMTELRGREPLVAAVDADEDVGGLDLTLDDFYHSPGPDHGEAPAGLEDALQALFGDSDAAGEKRPAADLIRRLQGVVPAEVYRWTGWFPEHTRRLLEQMAVLAEQRSWTCAKPQEASATAALTAFITALAVSRIQGSTAPA
ncbi:MAG TPA: hypothetical protein VMS17_21685, partial [Gemmataceae bacterium]|nr:hypothetical protein [Gemmataceae bacterium]